MKEIEKILLGVVLFLLVGIGVSFMTGTAQVWYTKTIGKDQQNAEREVFESSQSYVEGKRQEALKYYNEYKDADSTAQQTLKEIVKLSFANFDDDLLQDPVKTFIKTCKY